MSLFRLRLLLLLALFLPVSGVAGADGEADRPVGEIAVPAAGPAAPAAEEPPLRVLDHAGGAAGAEMDWKVQYETTPDGNLSATAQATLAVACSLDRKESVAEIKQGGDRTARLYRNLDVGRHEVLKAIYARALVAANERLKAKGASPLKKVVPVNAGGTGDYTRDQDITVFVGDPDVEKVFFECVVEVARGPPFGLEVDPKKTGGIDFPQIEVTLFPGGNDLPDSRFATDVEAFKLRYTETLAKQKADVEAYLGGGADIEVKGRRRPGQMYVQEITYEDGRIGYRCETPGNRREAASLFSEPGPERFQRWQRASHVFSDYLQGWRHSRGGDHDPTKGPLKYLGRALEQLCHLAGREVWNDRTPMDEKVAVIARLWPHLDPKNPAHRANLEKRVKLFELAHYVKTEKKLPAGADGAAGTQAALIVLRRCVAATAGEMAREMLFPPDFDIRNLRPEERARFDAMSPAERHREKMRRDRIYRECVSHEAMENLLLTISMLRHLDQEGGRRTGVQHGDAMIAQMIASAPEPVRKVLRAAAEYTDVAARLEAAPDPATRRALRAELAEVRARLVAELPGAKLTGQEVLERFEAAGPKAFVDEVTAGRKSPFGAAAEEINRRFDEHLKQAFPSAAEEYKAFRTKVETLGKRGYVMNRLAEEAFQLDSISDALTLVEMYQGGASAGQYAEFLAINVLSRLHWSVGQFIAAARVGSVEDAKTLAKNLVFLTLSRLVPWAGQAKLVFDIARGLVTVTVGWSINVVNAELVDALYTGEAGRTSDDAAGTARGALRDSGFAVLDPSAVIRATDEKTGELRIVVDRATVYEQAFRRFTGLDPYDVPRGDAPEGPTAILVRAHDRFADLLMRQAAEAEPTWVYSTRTPRVTMSLDAADVESAITTLQTSLANWCGREAERVHSESGARSYKSYLDTEDAIVRGLRERFAADVLAGMIDAWQTRITAQILAMREIERTAVRSDLSGLAGAVADDVAGWLGRGAATGDDAPVYELDVRVDGVKLRDEDAFDGGKPVRVSGFLRGFGDVGENAPRVRIEVVPGTPKVLDGKGPKPATGDLIEDLVTVRAVPDGGGAPLAERQVPVRVRLPKDDREKKTVPILRHEERRPDGSLAEAYEYVKSFFGMPAEWVAEYGMVYHGAYERYDREERKNEERKYRFGVLDGPVRHYDPEGRLVHEIPYVNGKVHGLERRLDPDSQARLELHYENGWLAKQVSYAENGQMLRELTYEEVPSETVDVHMSGSVKAFWPDGTPRFHGAYANADLDLNDRGGWNGETIGGKTGTWEWFFPSGSLQQRMEYADGLADGPSEVRREDGTFVERGRWSKGLMDGEWEHYYDNGKLREKGPRAAGKKDGVWESFDTEGNRTERVTWRADRLNGPATFYWPGGTVAAEGSFVDDRREGEWMESEDWGRTVWKGTYRDDARDGRWKADRVEDGVRWAWVEANYREGRREGKYEERNAAGKVVASGSYENDQRTGRWTEVSDFGDRAEGSYAEGVPDGRWEFYDAKGKNTRFEVWRDGKVVGRGSYD